MASVIILCSYGGELVCENDRYTYKGGESKTTAICVDIPYEQLLSKMYKIAKSRPEDYDIRLSVLYPCTNQSVPSTVIEDADDVRMFLTTQLKHSDHYIPLFIKTIQHVNELVLEDPVGYSGFESLGEEHIFNYEYKCLPSQVPLSNTSVPVLAHTSNLLTSQGHTSNFMTSPVRVSADVNLKPEYMATPSFTRVDLPSTSNIGNVSGSDIPLPKQSQSLDFTTRLPIVPFEDAGFTNADLSLYSCPPNDLIDIAVGQTFKDNSRCKYILIQFAICNNFQYKVLYFTSKKFTVVCMEDKCEWRVHASRVNDAGIFKIKTYKSIYTCGMSWMKNDHRQASSKLANEL